MAHNRALVILSVALVTVAGFGCGADVGLSSTAEREVVSQARLVELFSWWTAPGEAEALNSLIGVHQRTHVEARMFNAAAASGTSARDVLTRRIAASDPPDLFQLNAHDVRHFLTRIRASFSRWTRSSIPWGCARPSIQK